MLAVVLALALGQLLPPELQPPTCMWGGVEIYCQSACTCSEVTNRLNLAKSEIESNWDDAPSDWWAGLQGWRIFITQKQYIPGPKNELLYGVTISGERRMVLSWDMCGVLHELIHVQEIAAGTGHQRTDIYDHPLWERNSAVREISDRFRLRFRNRPPKL